MTKGNYYSNNHQIFFFQIGNFKHTVKRIDDGHRLCNDLMSCIQERAKIEKSYSQQLSEWSKRWRQLIDKGNEVRPSYEAIYRQHILYISLSHQGLNMVLSSEHGWH